MVRLPINAAAEPAAPPAAEQPTQHTAEPPLAAWNELTWPPAALLDGTRPGFSPAMAAYAISQLLPLVTVTATAPETLRLLDGDPDVAGHVVLPETRGLAQAAADASRLQHDQDSDVVIALDCTVA